jgi:hypothetical protein
VRTTRDLHRTGLLAEVAVKNREDISYIRKIYRS